MSFVSWRWAFVAAAVSITLGCSCTSKVHAQTPITLHADDGANVYAYAYDAPGKDRPVILLFHQAGSNAAEYAPIAPRLVRDGFDCLAVDLRAGGSMFDATNETVEGIGVHPDGFLDALKDMEAAAKWAKTTHPASRVIVWGSSYSSSLAFLLVKSHPGQFAALLAFSPGEYFSSPSMVASAAASVTIPVYVTSGMEATDERNAHHVFSAVGSTQKVLFVPTVGGVHGASTLREDRDQAGAADNWRSVETFLRSLKLDMAPLPPAKTAPKSFPAGVYGKPRTHTFHVPPAKPAVRPKVVGKPAAVQAKPPVVTP